MFKAATKAGGEKKKVSPTFIPPKQEVKTEDFGLNKYLASGPKPKKNEVHLFGYFYNEKPMSYEINQTSVKQLDKKEYDSKVAVKEVKGLVIKKTQLSMKESNTLYICNMNVEEEKEKEKTL